MKYYKKILLSLFGLLIIVATTYAWKAGGGVKWIGEVDQSNRFIDYSTNTSNYGTGYYLDTYTGLKWQALENLPYGLKWASGSRDSGDDNYYVNYPEPLWDGSHYIYNPPSGGVVDDYQAFKYCESVGDGYWRLPTRNELFSIMTHLNTQKNSFGKHTKLASITHSNYWSSTVTDNSKYVSFAYFDISTMGDFYKYGTYNYTICVHD